LRSTRPRLYLETLRHLRGEQVRHQVRRRLGLVRGRIAPAPSPLPLAPVWGPRVRRCRPTADPGVLEGRFRVWGREARLDLSTAWREPALGLSWNYPVHYFDALPGLAEVAIRNPERVRDVCSFVARWIDVHPPGTPVAWDPYPTALRIVNWLDAVHVLGSRAEAAWRDRILSSLYLQAAWLGHRLERHLLGTHLLKDAKALLLAGATFSDARARARGRKAAVILRRELRDQVGSEGAHIEPSVMYHCMALEDLLDLLNFGCGGNGELRGEVEAAAQRMLWFAAAVQTPAGGTPLLGDAWEGGAPGPAELAAYADRLGLVRSDEERRGTAGMRLFLAAGILVWRDARAYLVADVGGIGPPHLSAHGHCDSLSFECWIDGQPIVVDSGTYTYEPGELRHACRATRAHNTLELDGFEQHEIWEAFRVARRSSVRTMQLSESAAESRLVPWYDKRLQVMRRFDFAVGALRVHDRVEGRGSHRITSRLHLHPDCELAFENGRLVASHGGAAVEIVWRSASAGESPGAVRLLRPDRSGSHHAARAGEARPNAVLVIEHAGTLPFESELSIRPLGTG
jgi:uncharacterized heparinase superfamily protein